MALVMGGRRPAYIGWGISGTGGNGKVARLHCIQRGTSLRSVGHYVSTAWSIICMSFVRSLMCDSKLASIPYGVAICFIQSSRRGIEPWRTQSAL
jgi:hypothetical protein